MNNQKIIIYFSQTGHTKQAAEKLAKIVDADILEIKPENPYTEKDLDGYNESSRTYKEQHDSSSRPEIKNVPESLNEYDIVFIGYPIWWYIAPRLIYTFINSANLSGKKVIPFATSYESSIEKSCEDLKQTFAKINWGKGKLLNQINEREIEDWLND